MKAIVLERRGEEAALLCEDGTFVTRRVNGEVGETVELSAAATVFPKKRRWMRGAVAAALALAVTGGTLGYMGGTASAYVSLDVEDSAIELAVNHFGRVIAVNALSEDAAELAEALRGEVRHKKPEDALDITLERMRDDGYLAREDAELIAGVTSDNAARSAALKQAVEQSVGDEERPVHVCETSRAEREQAMERKISAGRFGFERDFAELPSPGKAGEGAQRAPVVAPEASAPASGAEGGIPADTQPAEQPAQDAPQSGIPAEARQNAPAQGGGQTDEPARQIHQDGERSNSWGEAPLQGQLTQEPPTQEQPPQEQPTQGQPTQEPPTQEQLPQEQSPQEQSPQGQPLRNDGQPQTSERQTDAGQAPAQNRPAPTGGANAPRQDDWRQLEPTERSIG